MAVCVPQPERWPRRPRGSAAPVPEPARLGRPVRVPLPLRQRDPRAAPDPRAPHDRAGLRGTMWIMLFARGDTRPEVRRAVFRFLVLSMLAMVVVAIGAIAWSIHVATSQAVAEAAVAARSMANGIVAPLCTPALRQGDPAALSTLDTVVRNRMRDGSVLRIKVWAPDGTIIYSDAAVLIGQHFDLEPDDRALLGTDRAKAAVSALDKPENGLEASAGRLVETYVGFRDTQGQPLLFEAYFPADPVDASARAIAWDLTPIAVITIVVLQLLQLPLALALARRLDLAHREHGRLLEHAVAAADLERRRMGRDLHDGVIQDLAGVGYMLESIEPRLVGADQAVRDALRRATDVVQADVRALRQTMADLHPADLSRTGLESAIVDLAAPLREAGVRCEIRVEDTAGLPEVVLQLLYRASRELLRNAAKHAQASEVTVRVERAAHRVMLTVADDGAGFDPEQPAAGNHLGLQLLAEAVRDNGGMLAARSAPGEGTTVLVSVGGF